MPWGFWFLLPGISNYNSHRLDRCCSHKQQSNEQMDTSESGLVRLASVGSQKVNLNTEEIHYLLTNHYYIFTKHLMWIYLQVFDRKIDVRITREDRDHFTRYFICDLNQLLFIDQFLSQNNLRKPTGFPIWNNYNISFICSKDVLYKIVVKLHQVSFKSKTRCYFVCFNFKLDSAVVSVFLVLKTIWKVLILFQTLSFFNSNL